MYHVHRASTNMKHSRVSYRWIFDTLGKSTFRRENAHTQTDVCNVHVHVTLSVCFHKHNDPEKYSRIRCSRECFGKFAQIRLIIRAPTRARLSRSIYFLLVITTEDDLCHGPQFDVIWAIVINLMSYMRSTHQNGSKANSLHLSPHKLCPFRNNEISQELRKRPYYPSRVDYVYL